MSAAPDSLTVEFAFEYSRPGWNEVPVRFKGKKPIGEGWQTRVIREADVPAAEGQLELPFPTESCVVPNDDADADEQIYRRLHYGYSRDA